MEALPCTSWLFWSSLLFVGLYAAGYWVVFGKRWPRGTLERYKAASCCMSIVHGTGTSLVAALYMLRLLYSEKNATLPFNNWLTSHLGAPNAPFENAIMEFSTAYFLVDLLHYVFFVPNQTLFILHHIFTSSYMLSCRFYTKHGAFSTIMLFVIGEGTSFLQNLWTFAYLTKNTSLFNLLNVPFLVIFTFFRGVITPWATWKLCLYYLYSPHASSVVPFWLALYWMLSVFMGIVGSLYWVASHWSKLIFVTPRIDASPPQMVQPPKKRRKYV